MIFVSLMIEFITCYNVKAYAFDVRSSFIDHIENNSALRLGSIHLFCALLRNILNLRTILKSNNKLIAMNRIVSIIYIAHPIENYI